MKKKKSREEIIEFLIGLGIYKLGEKQLYELSTSELEDKVKLPFEGEFTSPANG